MDTVAVSELSLGDTFRASRLGSVKTVAKAALSVDGRAVHLIYGDRSRETLDSGLRVERLTPAPACGCGLPFEHCEKECEWPDWLDNLYFKRF